ncbi:MAG: protein kinase [Planctomycetales bacterium]|nr:protein kinase [Planctomycetales bacterium]
MNCYSPDELRDFALGKLTERNAAEVEQHLQSCSSCEETIASLDEATDSLIRDLKQPVVVASSYAADSVFQRALQQVQSDPFQPNVNHPAPSSPESSSPGPSHAAPDTLRDYQIVEPLGQGGMGTVYRAMHLRLHRQVAFKLLPERRLRDTLAVARFQREMQTIGQMDHPAIVRAMDAGEVNGHHYLAMELIDGVDLGRLCRHLGRLDIGTACELIRQAAIGLAYVHERGIVHRDIKPSNLMLDRHGAVKVLDLGLALLDGVHGAGDELTTVGQLMGTLDYMAPEQFQDSRSRPPRRHLRLGRNALQATNRPCTLRRPPDTNHSTKTQGVSDRTRPADPSTL